MIMRWFKISISGSLEELRRIFRMIENAENIFLGFCHLVTKKTLLIRFPRLGFFNDMCTD